MGRPEWNLAVDDVAVAGGGFRRQPNIGGHRATLPTRGGSDLMQTRRERPGEAAIELAGPLRPLQGHVLEIALAAMDGFLIPVKTRCSEFPVAAQLLDDTPEVRSPSHT